VTIAAGQATSKPIVGSKAADKRVNTQNGSMEGKIIAPPTPSEQLPEFQ